MTATQTIGGNTSDWADNVFFTVINTIGSGDTKHNIMGMDPCDSQNHAIFNTTTQKRNFVDQRTGLFEVYVPLPFITGNNGNGPVVDMSLFYSPVVNNSAALGDGWSFAFTTYNEKNQQLTLHSGEILQVEKYKNFRNTAVIVQWQTNGLTVLRKGGRKEVLIKLAGTQIYVPESLTTDGLSILFLRWATTIHTLEGSTYHQIQLTSIGDSTRGQLLRVEYTPADEWSSPPKANVKIIFWPNNPSETLSYILTIENNALSSVTLAEHIKSTFEYQDHGNCGWLLTGVTTFDGLKESVNYDDDGLEFPENAKLSQLPCVISHTLTPNNGRTPVVSNYEYELRPVEKVNLTIVKTGTSIPFRREEFHYDESHEMTRESTGQYFNANDFADLVKFYKTEPNLGFAKRILTTRYQTQTSSGYLSRSETSFTSFNINSSIIEHQQNGKSTKWTYNTSSTPTAESKYNLYLPQTFPESYVVSEVITDAKSGISASTKSYQYSTFSGASEAKLVAVAQRTSTEGNNNNTSYIIQETNYFDSPDKGIDFRNGRTKGTTRSGVYGDNSALRYYFTRKLDYTLGSINNTELTTTFTSYATPTDYASATPPRLCSETHSILSGRLIRKIDENGNRTDFSYNCFGQLETYTTCSQSEEYKQTTTYAYPAPGQLKITEPNDRVRLLELDGQDNVVREYVWNGQWLLTKDVSYDHQGRELRTTLHDYLADGTRISEWSQLKYDCFNAVCGRLYSDGHEDFDYYDPIAFTRTEWTGIETDQHRQVTTYNEDETIAKLEWKDSTGAIYQTQTFTYSFVKLVQERKTQNELGTITTAYTYDGIGRILSERHTETRSGLPSYLATHTYYYQYPEDWLITEARQVEIEFNGVRRTLGKRTFDLWGRVTSLTRGTSTETFSYTGASQVPASKVTADGRTLSYEYIKELNNRLGGIRSGKEAKTFTYASGQQNTSSASEGECFLEYNHDLNFQVKKQREQTFPHHSRELNSLYSTSGRLLSDTDASGKTTEFSYNSNGQRTRTSSAELKTIHVYNNHGLLSAENISHRTVRPDLAVTYEYDTQQREIRRHFTADEALDLTVASAYNADSSLQSVQLISDGQVLGTRIFTYVTGRRVSSCKTTGVWRPETPKGEPIDLQEFTYDAMGNVITCVNTIDRRKYISTYTYDAASNSRLETVTHDHPNYSNASLSYDRAGRVTQDQTGKKYTYDWLGRLTQAGSTRYEYDPSDRLMSRNQGNEQYQIVYHGIKFRREYDREVSPGSEACTVQQVRRSGVDRTLFLLRDYNGTVLVTYDIQAGTQKHHAYTAYGEHCSTDSDSLLGFNGEYLDPDSGQSPLGQGYRWYDPSSRQFNAADTLSPFGAGGPHSYGYCTEGDPVNYQDPSGHVGSGAVNRGLRAIWGDHLPGPLSVGKYGPLILAVLWGGVGVLAAPFTGGASLLLTAAMISLAVISLATAIISVLIADTNPELSEILAWVSLATGAAGGVVNLLKKVGQLVLQLARSGMAVAKNLFQKAAVSATPMLRRARLFTGHNTLYGQSVPRPSLRTVEPFPFNQKSLIPAQGATPLFDLGDVNTVTFVTTGVLGNAGVFESERDQFINTAVGEHTWLPWGNFMSLWTKVRVR
ncbi:MAG: RHS repeat-associated core domain-containing protein [Pseudomonas sp.]